jgi:hypothetical protein
MEELIKKLCKAKILLLKLEGRKSGNHQLILEDVPGYMMRRDHQWRYSPKYTEYGSDGLMTWEDYRDSSIIAQLLKEYHHEDKLEEFYEYCKEVFRDGD